MISVMVDDTEKIPPTSVVSIGFVSGIKLLLIGYRDGMGAVEDPENGRMVRKETIDLKVGTSHAN